MPCNKILKKHRNESIGLQVGTKHGMTMWMGTENDDLLLAVHGHVLLFENDGSMREFIENDQSSNLSGLTGYQAIQQLMRDDRRLSVKPRSYFKTDTALVLLREDWSAWDAEMASGVLNVCNILWDIAVTVHEMPAIDVMSAQSKFGEFLDALTFYREEQLQSLRQFKPEYVQATFARIAEVVLAHLRVMK